MHSKSRQSLSDAFLEDHQHLTRGLSGTLEALERNDLPAAIRLADELDQRAGPHIRFEEDFFYPQVARSRGTAYVSTLLDEHEAGRQAIQALLASRASGPLAPDALGQIRAGLREALDHAVSCGTLLSHVTTLDAGRQAELLDRLLTLREKGQRWTESRSDDMSRAESSA